MHSVFYFMSAVTFFCGMGLLASVMLTRTSRATFERVLTVTSGQVKQADGGKETLAEARKYALYAARWIRMRVGINEKAELLERFEAAGLNGSSFRDAYAASRVVGPALGVGIGLLLPGSHFFWMLTLAGLFYLIPDIVLTRLIKRRRERIRLGVPDAIDLLVICVDAGLGLDQAILRVGLELASSHPEIHDEFIHINREQRAGKLRLDAWTAMAKRTQVQEIDGFVNMLMQTDRFGTPISRALTAFGEGIRQRRRQRAEELAAKTTVKIIFPLVFFIFPSIFIVLIGPAGLGIMRSMSGTP